MAIDEKAGFLLSSFLTGHGCRVAVAMPEPGGCRITGRSRWRWPCRERVAGPRWRAGCRSRAGGHGGGWLLCYLVTGAGWPGRVAVAMVKKLGAGGHCGTAGACGGGPVAGGCKWLVVFCQLFFSLFYFVGWRAACCCDPVAVAWWRGAGGHGGKRWPVAGAGGGGRSGKSRQYVIGKRCRMIMRHV